MINSARVVGSALLLILITLLVLACSCSREDDDEKKPPGQDKDEPWEIAERKMVLEALTRYQGLRKRFQDEQQKTINASRAIIERQLERLKQSTGPGDTEPPGDQPRCLIPKIIAVHPDNQVGAGEEFIIEGECFGDVPGEVRLIGGPLLFLPTEIKDWSPSGKYIVVRVLDIAGVEDHEAIVMVKTKDDATSNQYLVNFVAKKEIISLPMKSAALVNCGDDGNIDQCNDWKETDGTFIADQCTWVGAACGHHYNDCGAVGDDEGTDIYEIDLQNSWKIHDYWLYKNVVAGEGDCWVLTGASPVGTSYWQPQIKWSVTPCDGVTYALFVSIEGPVGVPFK